MKRLLALVLSLLLLVPAALAAPVYEDALPGYYKPPLMNEGQYPIKGENLKLTYWMPINSGAAQFISSYEENPAYQLIQENTGVDIEFIHPAAGTDKESFQLLFGGVQRQALRHEADLRGIYAVQLIDVFFHFGGAVGAAEVDQLIFFLHLRSPYL